MTQGSRPSTGMMPFLQAMNNADNITKLSDVFREMRGLIHLVDDQELRAKLSSECIRGQIALSRLIMP